VNTPRRYHGLEEDFAFLGKIYRYLC